MFKNGTTPFLKQLVFPNEVTGGVTADLELCSVSGLSLRRHMSTSRTGEDSGQPSLGHAQEFRQQLPDFSWLSSPCRMVARKTY